MVKGFGNGAVSDEDGHVAQQTPAAASSRRTPTSGASVAAARAVGLQTGRIR